MKEAKFSIGQIIHHQKFNYRGVIFDVDPIFSLTNEWYEEIAKSKLSQIQKKQLMTLLF